MTLNCETKMASSTPQQLANGLWNCSSPSSPDLKRHLRCNLKVECDGGEDELGCSYTPCDHSGVTVAGRCYFKSPTNSKASTWYDSNNRCGQLGARLASLNTPGKVEEVDRLGPEGLYLGLTSSASGLPAMYRYMMQWQDTTVAFYVRFLILHTPPLCGIHGKGVSRLRNCKEGRKVPYDLCEMHIEEGHDLTSRGRPTPQYSPSVHTTFQNKSISPEMFLICPRGHVVHIFLSCDQSSACFSSNDVSFSTTKEMWALPSESSYGAILTSLPPSFICANGGEYVPYTLVCDHRQDCQDNSDEDFCVFPSCDANWQLQCKNGQCVPSEHCDGFVDCFDETDEERCKEDRFLEHRFVQYFPSVVMFDGRGDTTITQLPSSTAPCPNTHFKCMSIDYCMPVFVRCNGVNDCPEKEDENGCGDSWTCFGLYRCRGLFNMCLHPDHLCDGWAQCSQHDDERFCNLTCPAQCSCLGNSWFCRHVFLARHYPQIRFLDAGNSGMKPTSFTHNTLLIHLSLSNCGITDINNLTLPNIHSLGLHRNDISVVKHSAIEGLPNLNTLFLSGNPLTSLFDVRLDPILLFPKLTHLDLSDVNMRTFSPNVLDSFSNLRTLNLSGCGIESISTAFKFVSNLRVLDVRGNPFDSFSAGMLKPLARLRTVRADNFKVCCPATLPDRFDSIDCESSEDIVASCDDLFKENFLRVLWNLTTLLLLVCNLTIVLKRLLFDGRSRSRPSEEPAADVFMTCLFVCGSIHGTYMAIIGIADITYRGSYSLKDTAWRQGTLCMAGGFLWLFSVELSLYLVCLMTLDRVLVSWCPCTSWRFSKRSAVVAMSFVLIGGIVIALVPLLPPSSHWKLFQTALCTPLFLVNQKVSSHPFMFGVFSVFHVIVSWLVGLGQLLVYVCLHMNRFAFVLSPNQLKQLSTSRRVMALVLCDVAFWLVAGHASHLAAAGTTVSDDVMTIVHVVAMPLNWTLKPVLHVVVTLLERRRVEQEQRMAKMLTANKQT